MVSSPSMPGPTFTRSHQRASRDVRYVIELHDGTLHVYEAISLFKAIAVHEAYYNGPSPARHVTSDTDQSCTHNDHKDGT